MWNGHRITLSGTINGNAETGNCLRIFYILVECVNGEIRLFRLADPRKLLVTLP